jgi:probable phosphoglycerate mutase
LPGVIEKLRVLLFAHAHIFRVLAARWLGLPPGDARLLVLGVASLSILGYEHNRDEPAIRLWNDQRHLGE